MLDESSENAFEELHPSRAVALGIRFFLELGVLVALAVWGLQAIDGPTRYALAIGAPVVAAVVWGMLVAPTARYRLDDPSRLLVEVLVFGAGIGALAVSGYEVVAIAFGVVAAVDLVLVSIWRLR